MLRDQGPARRVSSSFRTIPGRAFARCGFSPLTIFEQMAGARAAGQRLRGGREAGRGEMGRWFLRSASVFCLCVRMSGRTSAGRYSARPPSPCFRAPRCPQSSCALGRPAGGTVRQERWYNNSFFSEPSCSCCDAAAGCARLPSQARAVHRGLKLRLVDGMDVPAGAYKRARGPGMISRRNNIPGGCLSCDGAGSFRAGGANAARRRYSIHAPGRAAGLSAWAIVTRQTPKTSESGKPAPSRWRRVVVRTQIDACTLIGHCETRLSSALARSGPSSVSASSEAESLEKNLAVFFSPIVSQPQCFHPPAPTAAPARSARVSGFSRGGRGLSTASLRAASDKRTSEKAETRRSEKVLSARRRSTTPAAQKAGGTGRQGSRVGRA